MFPEITEEQTQTDIETNEKAAYYGKSFLYDFKKGDFVMQNGKFVEVTGKEAIKVWIEKILRTEKFRFKVYDNGTELQYGITIEDLIVGRSLPQSFVESELKREIHEALLQHPEIESLADMEFLREGSTLTISFTVNLLNGGTLQQEVEFD